MSASSQFPDGVANSSGLVGKYLMFNQFANTFGVFEHELNEFKSVQATRVVHDFYDADPKRGFYGGGGIDARIGPNPAIWTLSGPPGPQWGKSYKDHLRAFPRTMLAASHSTSLAVEANSVSLDPTLKDAWGMPAMRCTYKDHADDIKFATWLEERATEILNAAGALQVWHDPITEQSFSVHLLGTCRMGNDRAAVGRRPVSPYARRPQSVPMRRQQLRHERTRPADDDDPGAGVSGGRAHRWICAPQRAMRTALPT